MVGVKIAELSTPALIIDLDIVEHNLAGAVTLAQAGGKKLRPHIKTHKIPKFAAMQLESGAVGISAAKLSEAEIMADSGITDILLANEVIGEDKLERMAGLAKRSRLCVLADSADCIDGLAAAAQKYGLVLDVMLEVETGDRRCGANPEEAVALAQRIISAKQLRFRGLETFGGSVYHSSDGDHMAQLAQEAAAKLLSVKERLESSGIVAEEISIGGSPSLAALAQIDGITELRPGVYIFNDTASVYRGSASFSDCAATVLVTVISKPEHDRMVVDGGAKTFSYCCPGSAFGKKIYYGVLKDNPDIPLTRLSEEHGVIECTKYLESYHIGDKVEIIPTHACPVVNLFDYAYLCRNGVVVEELPVAARGKTQ